MRRNCRHDLLRGIYGDEINAAGGKRSKCLHCGALFAALPPEPGAIRVFDRHDADVRAALSPSAAAPTTTPASGGRSPAALDLDRDIDKGPRACDPTEP